MNNRKGLKKFVICLTYATLVLQVQAVEDGRNREANPFDRRKQSLVRMGSTPAERRERETRLELQRKADLRNTKKRLKGEGRDEDAFIEQGRALTGTIYENGEGAMLYHFG